MSTTGLKETIESLDELDRKVQRTIVRKSLRAGAKKILATARSDAPELTGLLKRNIKIRSGGSRKGATRLTVGIGAKDFTGPAFYGAFLVYGHKVGSRRLGGARTQVPANNFLKRADDESGQDAIDTTVDTLNEMIEQEANK